MVTKDLIGSVLEVLDIVVKDVKRLPDIIGNKAKKDLSPVVQGPLESVIALGKSKFIIFYVYSETFSTIAFSETCACIWHKANLSQK